MFDIHRVELDWGGRTLILETGKIARQADGAVVATYGESKVLATVVAAKEPREGIDFMPLTVDYQEKFYAAGRILGRALPVGRAVHGTDRRRARRLRGQRIRAQPDARRDGGKPARPRRR